MLALQMTAFVFLALSVAFFFGPRLAVYGPKAMGDMVQEGQVQFVGGCLASVLVLIVGAPYFVGAMSTGSDAMSIVMLDLFTMTYSLV